MDKDNQRKLAYFILLLLFILAIIFTYIDYKRHGLLYTTLNFLQH